MVQPVSAALRAQAVDFQAVPRGDEAVGGSHLLKVRLEVASHELDHPMAARTDEMVMVLIGADAIAELAGMMAEDVDDPLVAKERERPVDRCEPDPAPAAPETSVELLRRHVVGLLDELAENRHALRGRTNPVPLEQPLGPLTLRRGGTACFAAMWSLV